MPMISIAVNQNYKEIVFGIQNTFNNKNDLNMMQLSHHQADFCFLF